MKNLLSIRARETAYRNIVILVILVCFIFSGSIYYMSHLESIENKRNIYIMVNDKNLVKAQATDITNSIDILTQGAIEDIHKNIYEIVPDTEQINIQLTNAVTASDRYTSAFIDVLKQKNFYNIVIQNNFYTLLHTDSINVNFAVNPHKFNYMGTLKIIRKDQQSLRQIETEGLIQYTGRSSKNNERGFIVSELKLISDREIE